MGDLSEHFSKAEFSCKCGCDFKTPDPDHVDNLERLRAVISEEHGERPITIVSGNRCEPHNKRSGGAKASRHMYGDATDIAVKGLTPDQIIRCAEKVGPLIGPASAKDGFGGLGCGYNIAHVDSRPRKKPSSRYPGARARWTYGGKAFKWSE
jgi:hypothetical protein